MVTQCRATQRILSAPSYTTTRQRQFTISHQYSLKCIITQALFYIVNPVKENISYKYIHTLSIETWITPLTHCQK